MNNLWQKSLDIGVEQGAFVYPNSYGGYAFNPLADHRIVEQTYKSITFGVPENLPDGTIYIHTHPTRETLQDFGISREFKNSFSQTLIGPNPCPADDETNRAIMEEYLTISEWADARQETNTDHLNTSQITVLKDSEDGAACEQFNNQYEEAIPATWSDNGETYEKYDVTYYKVGNYFFVIISLSQYEGYISSGVAYLDVYDDNLNLIKGYAF